MKITKNTRKTILKVIGTIIATIAGALGINGMTPQ